MSRVRRKIGPADRPSGSESDAEMKITMRRDTWTALLAAVVRVRPSGSVGPRSDRTGVERWRPAAWTERGGRRGEEGWREGGGRRGRETADQRRVSCCQGCCGIRGCRVRRVAARVETRERSSDPLARYRATHSRVRRRP